MKIFFVGLCFSIQIFAGALPQLELELTGHDYYRLLKHADYQRESFKEILNMGKRFYEWLNQINEHRDPEHQISITSSATQPGYPIESPRLNNPTLINKNFDDLKGAMPSWLSSPLLDGAPLTNFPPVSDTELADGGRRVSRVYESASRWILEEPYLNLYAARKASDISGYYFLGKEPNLDQELGNWTSLDSAIQKKISDWLIGQCLNSNTTPAQCNQGLQHAVQAGNVRSFFTKYQPYGKRTWDSFFQITSSRTDVDFTSQHPNLFQLPFQTPATIEIQHFLTENIEDEWRAGLWQLKLNFQSTAAAHIRFVPGATPHVNELAGNEITMDANAPLTEYGVKWTIRHEFGHVLGFPDCYLEYYDEPTKTMISYQLDITNLMCSRRGKLKATHVEELQRVYLRRFS